MLDGDMVEATDDDLHQAADRLGVVLIGQPVRSYFSFASKARGDDTYFWLRVRRMHFLTWTSRRLGYEDSSAIKGVPKPVVVDSVQWLDAPHAVQAELLTYVSEPVISPTIQLTAIPNLPDSWWTALQSAIENLGCTPTQRDTAGVLGDVPYLRRFYGTDLPTPIDWATEHEDPHWANITGPKLNILDWDFWGRQPRGFTVAGLFCSSLGVPEVSDRLWGTFNDVFDTASGQWCVLYHIWYRRKTLSSFFAWERAAEIARLFLRDLT